MSEFAADPTTISGSNSWFSLSVTRAPVTSSLRDTVGLQIHVTADASVEAFMRGYSDDDKIEAIVLGNNWTRVGEEELLVYNLNKTFKTPPSYSINHVGQGLIINDDINEERPLRAGNRVEPVVNLSMLRLVGISRPEGVKFGLTGAYSKMYIRNACDQIIREARNFIGDYITPVTINLAIVNKR